jgi:hypothetical protein
MKAKYSLSLLAVIILAAGSFWAFMPRMSAATTWAATT